ncbi:hypothetical protein [Sphingomicrobium sediminis]|uniref:Excinuclease ABC subunit A n=1 Tax=Sphingomicrobium sediminis TaxID=2950949 RepID=A0A9X2EGE1_9SPHN|nr:hypothetical protein [Sphingomicrobium sediminis]MCM8557535.1 hypothetical protein [Sphingomicrobium sediminis]
MNKIIFSLIGAASFAAVPALVAAPEPAEAKPKWKAASLYQPACPPGLAKKDNGCLPPGQAKKLYERGHRFDRDFRGYTDYERIPYDLRRRYDLDPRDRYVYDDNYIYRVDPTTLIVREVLDAIF